MALADREPTRRASSRCGSSGSRRLVGAGLMLLTMPAWANNFFLFQVMGWTFILGMIALSLMFLAGYGGMVSLIQMSVAAMAGYMVAIFGTSGMAEISMGLPWWLNIPVAIVIAASSAPSWARSRCGPRASTRS
jgi:ABC-type branched-subunit amino acid transport system permease subunit